MPDSVSYPGVYIEEMPSGVRRIASVATSITAFVGKAVRGPAGDPLTITSFADFERVFGGLHRDFTLGYAVRDFFLNGGATAIVVRLYTPSNNKASRSTFDIGSLSLEAASEGAWSQKVRVRIENLVKCDAETTTQNDDLGVVNILVGFAPLEPAEFVILELQQLAGRIQSSLESADS